MSAAYPTNECVFNISRETTAREICYIEGIPEQVQRAQGINLSGGHTNAVEFVTNIFGAPTFDKMLHAYQQHKLTKQGEM